MKVRFYPKTDTVRAVIQTRITDEETFMAANKAELATAGVIVRPGHGEALHHLIRRSENRIKELGGELALLNSHEPPELMVELDL